LVKLGVWPARADELDARSLLPADTYEMLKASHRARSRDAVVGIARLHIATEAAGTQPSPSGHHQGRALWLNHYVGPNQRTRRYQELVVLALITCHEIGGQLPSHLLTQLASGAGRARFRPQVRTHGSHRRA
jgi:hypothetical protein